MAKEGLIEMNSVIIDAKSGTSGAGRGAKVNNLYCEVNENIKAYGVATHRHTPEIEDQFKLCIWRRSIIKLHTTLNSNEPWNFSDSICNT